MFKLLARAGSSCALILAIAGGVAALPSVASAQQMIMMGEGPRGAGGLGPNVSKAEFEQLVKITGMSKDQQTAATVLYDAYAAEHEKRAAEVRTAQENAQAVYRESRDFSVFSEVATKTQAFSRLNAEKERELLADIKAILDKPQLDRLPTWERAYRRSRHLNRTGFWSMGLSAGERVDLIDAAEKAKFGEAARTAAAPTLEAYELELDRLLLARIAGQKEAEEARRGQGNQADGVRMLEDRMQKDREISTQIRDCNTRYLAQIEKALTGADAGAAERFVLEVKRVMFPEIYRERHIDKVLAAAEKLPGLDEAQRSSLAGIREQYTRRRDDLRAAGEKAAMDAEAKQAMPRIEGEGGAVRVMSTTRMDGESEVAANRKARRELDAATLDKVKAVLTPEQFAKLPERGKTDDFAEPMIIRSFR